MIRQIGHTLCSDKFKCIIAPIIIGVATSGLVFENLYFFKTLHIQNQILFRTLSTLLYIMCFISFYQSIKISNAPPSNIMKPRLKKLLRNNHPFYTEVNQCQKQNNRYKPPRTSHCSTCKCVVRMDHHCPYINNCVGLKNLKSFILFTGYGGLFALMFLVFSIKYYFDLKSQKVQPLSESEVTIWLILTFISFFLALSMCGLAISNIFFAGKNITQLQMLKGNLRLNDKYGTHPNPYDLGFFTNLNTLFQSQKWSFWYPSQIITENDGTQFIKVPQITYDDIKRLPAHIRENIKTVSQKSIPKTIEQLRKKQENNYANTVFFFLGKQYRLSSNKGISSQQKQQISEYNIQQSVDIVGLSQQKQLIQLSERERIEEQLKEVIENQQQKIQDEQLVQYKEIVEDIYGEEALNVQETSNKQNQKIIENKNDHDLLEVLDKNANIITEPQNEQNQPQTEF